MRSSPLSYACLACALMVSACQHNMWQDTDAILNQGWATHGDAQPNIAPTHTPTAENLYCYKSLAQVDCYTTPQPGKEHLRVGEGAPATPPKESALVEGNTPMTGAPCAGDTVDVHKLPMVIHKDA